MRPLESMVERADDFGCGIEVFPGFPFSDDLTGRRYFDHDVSKHPRRIVTFGHVTTFDSFYEALRQRHPFDDQRIAVLEPQVVVVNPWIVMAPYDVAVPIQFETCRGLTVESTLSGDIFGWHRERHDVSVGKQFGIADTERTLPAVHKTSLHVDEPRLVVIRRE